MLEGVLLANSGASGAVCAALITVTSQVAVLLPSWVVTVIMLVPVAMAVMRPLATVATVGDA